jgi:hypothetical protein
MIAINILIIALVLYSCSPQSKESYLSRYDSFITEVEKNRSRYTDADWTTKDREFKQLSEEWYEKFKNDFTWKEKLKLTAYEIKYNYYLMSKESSEFFKGLLDNPDVEAIKSQIKFYVDNQMDDDIAAILKEAKQAGKEVEKLVNEILNDLKVVIKSDDN